MMQGAHGSGLTDAGIRKMLQQNKQYTQAASVLYGFGTQKQSDRLIDFMVSNMLDKSMRQDYMRSAAAHSYGAITIGNARNYNTFRERLPDVFKNLKFDLSGTTRASLGNNGLVSKELTAELVKMAAHNNLLRKGIVRSGAGFMSEGNLRALEQFTQDQMDEIAGYVFKEFGVALQGAPRFRKDLNSKDIEVQKSLANKTSRRVEQGYEAMGALGKYQYLNPYLGVQKTISDANRAQYIRSQRVIIDPMMERYQAPKYTITELKNGVSIPLDQKELDANGKRIIPTKHGFIDVSESRNTRLLGMSGHNTYGTKDGTPAIVALDLEEIFEKGMKNGKETFLWDNGKRMINKERWQQAVDLINNGFSQYGHDYVYGGKNANGEVYFIERNMRKAAVDKVGYDPFTSFSSNTLKSEKYVNRKKGLNYDSKGWSTGED